MNKTKIAVLCGMVLLLSQLAFAPGGNSWVPSWTTQLGLNFNEEPGEEDVSSEFLGVIEKPDQLNSIGIRGVNKGTPFKITFLGRVEWKMKIGGKECYPAVVRFEIPTKNISVKLVPQKNDKGEVLLKPEKK